MSDQPSRRNNTFNYGMMTGGGFGLVLGYDANTQEKGYQLMSEFRQITDAEELEGKTIARVVTDENRDDDGQALVIFSDGSYTVFSPCLSYDEKPCIWIDEKPEFSYKFKHGIASPAEIAAHRQRAELEEQKMRERIAQQNRAEYERLKAMFEPEADNHETGQ